MSDPKDTKEKYQLEFPLRCSPKILYNYLSTPSGLSEWFADDVNIRENIYHFFWDGSDAKAKMVSKKDAQSIRYQWLDGDNAGSFFQFDIVQDELTGDVSLMITDHCEADELKSNELLWDSQIQALRHIIGS